MWHGTSGLNAGKDDLMPKVSAKRRITLPVDLPHDDEARAASDA